ncbi:DNA-binding response regulator [Adhaeribacter arboris]|uniref:DNA-binding response regulator n=1 Tax=Adhaeribacter arboris TaxID=2072846 RepID=A0A2T2YP90_9BACT|nr:response regulator transcription factor [Adhaeribacter arboris]PSR57332.1 DNA-binding response regulator [Adhaeribacter arboris]
MVRILLVEDDENLGFLVQDNLESEGYAVQLCADGLTGLRVFGQQTFDLCILDVMLPVVDGFTLAQEIRKINTSVPLIFLTAKSQPDDRIHGLRLGADDYLTKPFRLEELNLRLKAILKRTFISPIPNTIITFGQSRLDYPNLLLWVQNQKLQLTQKEADVLRMLCLQLNTIVKRELILKTIWEDNGYFVARSMDVFISKLRKYLRPDQSLRISTIHGVGYKLEELSNASK